MEVRKIVVPTDFSKESERALERATAWAGTFGAEIMIVHVVHYIAGFGINVPKWLDHDRFQVDMKAEAERELARACERCATAGMPVDGMVKEGKVDDGIVEAAREIDADLIIMARGGSTAGKVIRHAPCDVLVVKA